LRERTIIYDPTAVTSSITGTPLADDDMGRTSARAAGTT
jgi:hypothetical protein